jgi:uncharacterized repeat protein (TIGR03843 family)
METDNHVLQALHDGVLEVKGEFIWGSNYTFLAEVKHTDKTLRAVYKPIRGEQPLWDFPAASLAKREAAAYLVSEALGWRLVPPTVYRRNGPLGAGSLQLFIEHDPQYHYFSFKDVERRRLRPVALFDLLINNADRKGSHVLCDPQNHLWLIDHGVCFHVEYKLRTVIWDFIGQPIPPDLCADLSEFVRKVGKLRPDEGEQLSDLAAALLNHISQAELRALQRRAESLLSAVVFPRPLPNHMPVPWPQV